MFGCTFLIRTLREKNKKSDTHVRVHRARDIWERKQLDREGLVLFAMLSGGDYDPVGVRGCGAQQAWRIAKRGLGKTLCQLPDRELHSFRDLLYPLFHGRDVEIPFDWPRARHLNNYRNPKVSTQEELDDLQCRKPWDLPIHQSKLRVFLREQFQILTKYFLKHIAPSLLVQKLCNKSGDEGNSYSVEIVRSRKQNTANSSEESFERKIKFLPHTVVDFDITEQPETEDWSKLATKADGEFNPCAKLDCEILDAVLRRSLPASVFEAPSAKSPRKRKRTSRESVGHDAEDSDVIITGSSTSMAHQSTANTPRKRARPTTKSYPRAEEPDSGSDGIDDIVERMLHVRQRTSGRRNNGRGNGRGQASPDERHDISAMPQNRISTNIVDLGSESEDEGLPSPSELLPRSETTVSCSGSYRRRPESLGAVSNVVSAPDFADDGLRLARRLQATHGTGLDSRSATSVATREPAR